MAINPGFIAAQPVSQNNEVYIEFLAEEPPYDLILDTPKPPGLLLGYYNPIYNVVNLYIVGATGLRLSRVS